MISSNGRDYGTHLPPLLKCVLMTDGPVLELGCGEWSTPVLHALCLVSRRLFVSTETREDWAKQIGDSIGEKILCPPDLSALAKYHWSVVLIDHDPVASRVPDALRLAEFADFILIHDCQYPGIVDELAAVLDRWKYHFCYDSLWPPTMILSNTREFL